MVLPQNFNDDLHFIETSCPLRHCNFQTFLISYSTAVHRSILPLIATLRSTVSTTCLRFQIILFLSYLLSFGFFLCNLDLTDQLLLGCILIKKLISLAQNVMGHCKTLTHHVWSETCSDLRSRSLVNFVLKFCSKGCSLTLLTKEILDDVLILY